MALIDTSVLVAYLCPEALSAAAIQALRHEPLRLVTPLVEVELASALALKSRQGQMTAATVKRILQEYHRQLEGRVFTLRLLQPEDFQQASAYLASCNTNLRALDALHLAAAAGAQTRLLTADRELARGARKLGIPCSLIQ